MVKFQQISTFENINSELDYFLSKMILYPIDMQQVKILHGDNHMNELIHMNVGYVIIINSANIQVQMPAFVFVLANYTYFVVDGSKILSSNPKIIKWLPVESVMQHYTQFGTICRRDMNVNPWRNKISCGLLRTNPLSALASSLIDTDQDYNRIYSRLDRGQRVAFENIMCNDGMFIVEGCPGSGKSTLIVAVLEMLSISTKIDENYKMLLTSETNAAVDENLKAIAKNNTLNQLKIYRIGNMSDDILQDDILRTYYIEYLSKIYMERNHDRETMKPGTYFYTQKSYEEKLIKQAKIVLATCTTIAQDRFINEQFSSVLVDEASLVKDASLLGCLRKDTRKLVLLGDIYQRPPHNFLYDKDKYRYAYYDGKDSNRHYINYSVMRRFLYFEANTNISVKLHYQYRYHSDCMAMVQRIYPFKIYSGLSDTHFNYIPISGMKCGPLHITDVRVNIVRCLIDESKSDDGLSRALEDDNKFINFSEIESINKLLVELDYKLRCKIEPFSVLVFTPYHTQLHWLRRYIHENFPYSSRRSRMQLKIQTLDSSQGATMDIVIGSYVRRNNNNNIGFLRNDKEDFSRLLVGVSRMRTYLFLFNYYSLFESDDYWFKVLSLRNDRSGRAIATDWEAEYKALYRYNPRYPKELLRD